MVAAAKVGRLRWNRGVSRQYISRNSQLWRPQATVRHWRIGTWNGKPQNATQRGPRAPDRQQQTRSLRAQATRPDSFASCRTRTAGNIAGYEIKTSTSSAHPADPHRDSTAEIAISETDRQRPSTGLPAKQIQQHRFVRVDGQKSGPVLQAYTMAYDLAKKAESCSD